MKAIIVKNRGFEAEIAKFPQLKDMLEGGWGNGYVALPKGHPMHGMDYDQIHNKFPSIQVHCGLTFSAKAKFFKRRVAELELANSHWVIGFDTRHAWDTLQAWPQHRVLQETESLLGQIKALKPIRNPRKHKKACKKLLQRSHHHVNIPLTRMENKLNLLSGLLSTILS